MKFSIYVFIIWATCKFHSDQLKLFPVTLNFPSATTVFDINPILRLKKAMLQAYEAQK